MVYIIVGPTHCGKSTYIEEMKNYGDIVIDLFEYQNQASPRNIIGLLGIDLLGAHYEFLKDIERTIYKEDCHNHDLFIEGCFSNPFRVAQIINTILVADSEIEIQVHYLMRSEDWYHYHLDAVLDECAIEQQRMYKQYLDPIAAVYEIGDENTQIKRIN